MQFFEINVIMKSRKLMGKASHIVNTAHTYTILRTLQQNCKYTSTTVYKNQKTNILRAISLSGKAGDS